MTNATVYLTPQGAHAHKAHLVGRLGSDDHLPRSLMRTKRDIQAHSPDHYQRVETVLPEWDGDLKERAAVGLGHRRKFARFIERVEIH